MIFPPTLSIVQRGCSHRKLRHFFLEKKREKTWQAGKCNVHYIPFLSFFGAQHLNTVLYIHLFQNSTCQTMCPWPWVYSPPTNREMVLCVLWWHMRPSPFSSPIMSLSFITVNWMENGWWSENKKWEIWAHA